LKLLATIDDSKLKQDAESAANRVLGLPWRTNVEKTDDVLDKVIKIQLMKKMQQPKQSLMAAYAKNEIAKIRGRTFSSKREKNER
jgi:hypothetical protein